MANCRRFPRYRRIARNFAFAVKLGKYDPNRLASAFALVKSKKQFKYKIAEYRTSIIPMRCDCMDRSCREVICKHLIAIMLDGCIFN